MNTTTTPVYQSDSTHEVYLGRSRILVHTQAQCAALAAQYAAHGVTVAVRPIKGRKS